MCVVIARYGYQLKIMSRLIDIAVAGRLGLSSARVVGKVVISSFGKLYGVTE